MVVCIPSGVVKGQGDDPDASSLDWLLSNEENSVEGVFDIHDLENTSVDTRLRWRYGNALKHVRALYGYPGTEFCRDEEIQKLKKESTRDDRELRYIAVVKHGEGTRLRARSLVKKVGVEVEKRATVNTVILACLQLKDKLKDTNQLGKWYFAIRRRFSGITLSYKKFWTTDTSVQTALRAGWAYVGVKPADGQWRTKYFNWDGDPEPPKKGDTLRATGSVNLRADYIRFHANIRRWVNAEKIGLIRKGDRLKVLSDPKNVDNGFYWVRVVHVD